MVSGKRTFHITLEPAEDEPTDWYVATSRDLPGLVTQGKGIDDTVANVKDAIVAYFDGRPPAYSLDVRVVVPV
ncbi:MAG: type II toxin-antitoxin system HicB family antitoxin [Thermoplasmata archaeon]